MSYQFGCGNLRTNKNSKGLIDLFMVIGMCKVKLSIEWAESLKDKRSVVKSIIDRTKARFNVSAAEVGEQDSIRTAVVGFACVSSDSRLAQSLLDKIIGIIDEQSEAEIIGINRDNLFID